MIQLLQYIGDLFSRHPFWTTAITTWVTNTGASAFVSSLPSPTKNSTQLYIFFFKFLNRVVSGNFSRANGAAIETSPNWDDALAKAIQKMQVDGGIKANDVPK